jgi:hypothetical protein
MSNIIDKNRSVWPKIAAHIGQALRNQIIYKNKQEVGK